MLVRELKAFSKPVGHFEEHQTHGISISLCSRQQMIMGWKKPRKRFLRINEKVECPIYKRGYSYQLVLSCEPPQELPAAFTQVETAAQKYDLPLKQNFMVTPADMKTLTGEWRVWQTLGYGDDEEPETPATAVVTLTGIIRSNPLREEFTKYASAIAEPHEVKSGYQTISFLTGEAAVTQQPHLHLLQRWPEFCEDRVVQFYTDILAVARTHRGSLGIGHGTPDAKTRLRLRLPPYLDLQGSFVGEKRASGFYNTFRFAYFHT